MPEPSATFAPEDAGPWIPFGFAPVGPNGSMAVVVPGRVTEAVRSIEGLSLSQTIEAVGDALKEKFGTPDSMTWIWPRDVTETVVVYELEDGQGCETWQVGYTIDADGKVTISDQAPVKVEVKTEFVAVKESKRDFFPGRVLERKGTTAEGGRIFLMQMIDAGTSRNGVHYPESVLAAAAPLYEGAKAFDHHRTMAELQSSSVVGLCGSWRGVFPNQGGLAGELHLVPSAVAIAEALDQSLEAQEQGLPPVIGVSHDVQMDPPVERIENGRRVREATSITNVLSTDVVADPSAGGRAIRVVAGGLGSEEVPPNKETQPMKFKELLEKLRAAKTPEDRAALLAEHADVLEAAGYSADEATEMAKAGEEAEVTAGGAPAEGAEGDAPTEVTESFDRGSTLAGLIVREAVRAAGLPDRFVGHITTDLPARITEADVVDRVRTVQRTIESLEKDGMTPRVPGIKVGAEDHDKKVAKLDATFAGDWANGYSRLSEAYFDVTGQPYAPMTEVMAEDIMRESFLGGRRGRVTESLISTSWGEVLADVMNRRIVDIFHGGNWSDWKKLVTTFPVHDFRSQKLIQVGEFASLPTVNEGAPYQPLTSPTDQQATYSPTKKGGTEDFTYEAAKNDDLRQLVSIPARLGRVAQFTLYSTVFGILSSNPTLTTDSIALFHASHANTAAVALSQTNLSTLRQKMRDQAAYGDTARALGMKPKYLVVPNELEELAFQLCTSAVAVPGTPAGPSNTPNIHQGLEPLVVDIFTDANDWYVVGDPAVSPTIEVGFMDGKEDPELFVQDDPTVGSAFTADKVTYKLRHTWGYGVVDYRPFQRGTQ